jgi:hypothetical protein
MFTGSISALIANIFGYLSRLIHESTVVMPEVALKVFTKSTEIHSIVRIIFGNLLSFTVGGIFTLVFILILNYTGWRHLWWKNFAVTNGGFMLGTGLSLQLLGIAKEADLLSIILFYFAHLIYLTVAAFLVSRFGNSTSHVPDPSPTRL